MNVNHRSMTPIGRLQPPQLQDPQMMQNAARPSNATPLSLDDPNASSSELREAFTDFVGQTLFGSMLSSMRKTVGKPAYMHGGRTEEVFQQQLDQHIVDDMTQASADTIANPMFELFNMQRRA
jgi:hypothetical protein